MKYSPYEYVLPCSGFRRHKRFKWDKQDSDKSVTLEQFKTRPPLFLFSPTPLWTYLFSTLTIVITTRITVYRIFVCVVSNYLFDLTS